MDRDTWERDVYGPFKDKHPERREAFATSSGIPLAPVYGDGPFPGTHPYTRGIHPYMYRQRPWTMRQ